MRIFKPLAVLAAAAALVMPLAGGAQAQDYKEEYRVSTVVPPPFPWGIAAQRWADLVAERTDGRIQMKLYPGAQLVQGEQTREFTAMRRGIIDMAVGSTINWSPQIPEMNVFALPFLMPDYAALDAPHPGTRRRAHLRAHRGERRRAAGLGRERLSRGDELAAPDPHPPRTWRASKMRVVGSPIFNDIFSALGAEPHPDVVGRRAAGAHHRRGRRAGEPADHLHRAEDARARPDQRQPLALRRRSADLSR